MLNPATDHPVGRSRLVYTGLQRGIAHAALVQAKGFLSKKQPFIWNATNLLLETRRKLVKLFSDYHARVRILYLEVPYKELLARLGGFILHSSGRGLKIGGGGSLCFLGVVCAGLVFWSVGFPGGGNTGLWKIIHGEITISP